MRLLYLDLDALRPDHLGCYGYHRNTSPNIDRLAARGVRFDNCYVTDVPCLPSRTALMAGRCGYHTGVVNHGGVAAQPFLDGPDRGFQDTLGLTGWMRCLRKAGMHTAAISPFGERHSAWHWYACFNEIHNTGRHGMESAEEVEPIALDWLRRNGARDNWFLQLNLWDAHTPYRAPTSFGNPFAESPLPAWLNDDVRAAHWAEPGPHSAQEVSGFGMGLPHEKMVATYARQPVEMNSMAEVRRMFDGYDCGVRFADATVGRLLNALAELSVLEETAIILSSDHGENLGELNIYGDHQTADEMTTHVPLIISWPGVTDNQAGQHREALHYHMDFAATSIELMGGEVPANWDGQSFAASLKNGSDEGRESVVVSQIAWTCQRAVRWNEEGHAYIAIRTYHDGYHDFPDWMLFDLTTDPHEQHDLALQRPDLVQVATERLNAWNCEMKRTASHPQDPLETVLAEGGPWHTRGHGVGYVERLRHTGRGAAAERLASKHARELAQ